MKQKLQDSSVKFSEVKSAIKELEKLETEETKLIKAEHKEMTDFFRISEQGFL